MNAQTPLKRRVTVVVKPHDYRILFALKELTGRPIAESLRSGIQQAIRELNAIHATTESQTAPSDRDRILPRLPIREDMPVRKRVTILLMAQEHQALEAAAIQARWSIAKVVRRGIVLAEKRAREKLL